jgi:hypothetical protein
MMNQLVGQRSYAGVISHHRESMEEIACMCLRDWRWYIRQSHASSRWPTWQCQRDGRWPENAQCWAVTRLERWLVIGSRTYLKLLKNQKREQISSSIHVFLTPFSSFCSALVSQVSSCFPALWRLKVFIPLLLPFLPSNLSCILLLL